MMKVKYRLCTECKHPLDDHSAYRPICLHEDCSCKVDIQTPVRLASCTCRIP